jgi:hypothetical protein
MVRTGPGPKDGKYDVTGDRGTFASGPSRWAPIASPSEGFRQIEDWRYSKMSRRWSIILGAVVVLAAVFWRPGSAAAIHDVIIDFTVIRGEPFSTVTVATEEVEPWLQGESCAIRIEVANNQSVHEDNAVILSSGADVVTVPDVESKAGIVTIDEGELVLGETVVAAMRLGPDGVSSGGITVDFICSEQPPTTTIATTTSTTPVATSTTTEAPDVTLPPSQPETPTAAQPSFTG